MTGFLIQAVRGAVVESEHRIDAVVLGPEGRRQAWGRSDRPVIARSAVKYIQAMPLLTTGAADRYDVTDVELALAASSHSAEPAHVAAVEAWLDRIGLDRTALECGPDVPLGAEAARAFHRAGHVPDQLHNCCSGKHAGFLTVARHLGVDHRGYIEPDHPVQHLVTDALAAMTGVDLAEQRPGRDGCGIPVWAIPVEALARAMQRLVDPVEHEAAGATEADRAAAERLVGVPEGRQFWVSGTGRHEAWLGDVVDEPLVVKSGAEGVYLAGVPDRRTGVALKVADGATRAAEVAMSALLARLGVLAPDEVDRPIRNKAGRVVGVLRAVLPDHR